MTTTSAARWKRTLVRALGIDRAGAPPPVPSLDSLREVCRALVADLPPAQREAVERCITNARDAQDLWHLRSHLFGLVSLTHGEHVARERLKRLDAHWS